MGKTVVNSILFDSLTADPSGLEDGMIWYRSDLNEVRQRVNGATVCVPVGEIMVHDFGLNGIYGQSNTSYASIPLQVMIPELADLGANYTKIEAKLVLDYETDGASTMDARLTNYTDGGAVAGSEKNYPNQSWGHGSTGFFDVTAIEGKSVRIQLKRVGGSGQVKIEGAALILKYS